MNAFIGYIDIAVVLALLFAWGFFLFGRSTALDGKVRLAFLFLITLTTFRHVVNMLEWTALSTALVPVEDYVEALEPVLWGAFFYTFLQALTESRLRTSEERYRSLVENIDLGICLVDSDSGILMANAALGRFHEKKPEDMIGTHCYREFCDRNSMSPGCPGAEAMRLNRRMTVERVRNRKDGSVRTLRVHAFPTFNGGRIPVGFILLEEDITEQKRDEEKRQALEKKSTPSQEARESRGSGRRHRPRFQQSSHGHPGQCGHDAAGHG